MLTSPEEKSRGSDRGAIMVEAAIAASFLFVLLLTGYYLSRYVNTHAILIAAARNTSRTLSQYDPTGDGALPPGHTFSEDEYVDLVTLGIQVANRYIEIAGLDPANYNYRVSSLPVSAGTGNAGQGSLNAPFEEIEVAISSARQGPFEPEICARARFKYELFHRVDHYPQTDVGPC